MPELTIATLATSHPMGQQVYEEQVAGRASDVLGPDWHVDRAIIRTLRSPLPGTARLPARALDSSNPIVRRVGAKIAYRGGVVHRMDLRLPPAGPTEVLTILDAVSWRFPDEALRPSQPTRSPTC
jgi:hypothetical protein